MTKNELVSNLISSGYLKTPSIIKAFQKVDRADFVLPEYRELAYEDQPLPIGFGQTISQPRTVAMMMEWLFEERNQNLFPERSRRVNSSQTLTYRQAQGSKLKVLDIGCGSGWTTALLASIAGKKGKVIGIERIPELAEFASQNLAKYPLLQRTSTVVQEDGSKGYEKEAPYDRILASAASSEIPKEWKKQLKVGGRIVAPVEDSVVIVDKLSLNKYQTTVHWGFAFVPLIKD